MAGLNPHAPCARICQRQSQLRIARKVFKRHERFNSLCFRGATDRRAVSWSRLASISVLVMVFAAMRSLLMLLTWVKLLVALDSISALRRMPFSFDLDQKLIPFDCESPGCPAEVCAENESPSRSMDRCLAEMESASAY